MARRHGRPVRRALCPLLVLLAFLSGLLLLPGQALASDRSYQITQVDIDATVDADGTLHVMETRTFDFDGSFNGVYWDIPTGYNPNNGQEVEINVTSAGESTAGSLLAFQLSDSDEDGTYSISDRGSIQRLKIYSAHRNEKAKFTIAYDATGIATRWQDTGELYWKFVSDGWDVSSNNVTCTLHLPVPAGEGVTPGQNVRAWGHGPLDGSVSFSGSDVVFTASGVGTDEYAEMRVTFPQSWLSGLLQSSAGRLDSILSEEQQWADEANARRTRARILVWGTGALAAIAAVGTVVLALLKKRKYDRDNEPDFKDKYFRDVPTSDHPAVLGALFNGGSVEGKELTATLMHLTDEGYISLEKVTTKKKGLFGDKVREDYRVTKLKGMPRSSGSARDKATHTVDSKTLSLLFKTISDDGEKLYFSRIESFAKKEPELYHSAYEKWEGAVTGKYAERFEDGGEKGNGRGWLVLAGVIDCILAFAVFVAYLIFEASVLAMIGLPLLLVAAAVGGRGLADRLHPPLRGGSLRRRPLEPPAGHGRGPGRGRRGHRAAARHRARDARGSRLHAHLRLVLLPLARRILSGGRLHPEHAVCPPRLGCGPGGVLGQLRWRRRRRLLWRRRRRLWRRRRRRCLLAGLSRHKQTFFGFIQKSAWTHARALL